MCLFCNKINLKYRYKPYYEVPFIDYTTRMFNTLMNENTNFFIEANKDSLINIYIDSIKNVIKTQMDILNKNKSVDINNINIDLNLLLLSAIDNLDMKKYKILSKMLYEIDMKYLDFAKESIINSNKNKSLDIIVYGIELKETFLNNNINNNQLYINILLIIILIILIILIIIKCKN